MDTPDALFSIDVSRYVVVVKKQTWKKKKRAKDLHVDRCG